jgi:hypothetical protein
MVIKAPSLVATFAWSSAWAARLEKASRERIRYFTAILIVIVFLNARLLAVENQSQLDTGATAPRIKDAMTGRREEFMRRSK